MPPQVGKAGGGTGPVVVPGTGGAEQPNSPDLQNKPAEQNQVSPKNSKSVPYRATNKEASNRKAELAAGATSQQTTLWKTFNNIATAAVAGVGEITANAARSVQQQDMMKLAQREYRQDMVPGGNFEVEKITPGSANKTQTRERVEDLSRGDVYETRRHPEQHRESTKSGLENRLKELNQAKELTPFEKKLVAEWDPNKKDGVASLSPIKAVDHTGTNGPPGIQGYRVERGESDSKYRQITYYDRDGNELLQGPTIQKQKMNKLSKSDHPQDMVPGEYFAAEEILPGNTNQTKSSQHVDLPAVRIQSAQVRTSTKSALEDRMKELNHGKELTPFEKKLVTEWDPNRRDNNAIGSLSPIMKLDSTGTRGSTEVEGYKVVRGDSGFKRTTYYDRQGNELITRHRGGEAIATDGPVDYISLGRVAGKMAVNTGKKIGERLAKKEVEAVAKAEVNAVAKSEVNDVAKVEANSAAKAEANTAAKTETNIAEKSSSSPNQTGGTRPTRSANQVEPEEVVVKGEKTETTKQTRSASNTNRSSQKEDIEKKDTKSKEEVANRRKGRDWEDDEFKPRTSGKRTERMSDANKVELQESPELRAALPEVEHRREWMKWLENNHTKEIHDHVRPGSPDFWRQLREWSDETGRHVNFPPGMFPPDIP